MESKGVCFVIQPFDGGPYDKRFEDVFAPAIRDAHLDPYRVDRDPRASVPIEEIQSGIRRSAVCFAEITEDNPNVWFELGYAIASGKEVVLVCSDKRAHAFPFDIQHRSITKYQTESSSDFTRLRKKITDRLVATLEKQLELDSISDVSPIQATEGLSPHEIVTLVTVAESIDSMDDRISAYNVRESMRRAGFTDIAVTLATRSLDKKHMIATETDTDYNGNEFTAYRVTDRGLEWLETNKGGLILKKPDNGKSKSPFDASDDDLPF